MFPVGSSDLHNMLVSFVQPCLCFPIKSRCVGERARVCEAVYAEECVLGGTDPVGLISVFVRMLYFLPRMAWDCVLASTSVLRLCSASSAVL